MLKSEQVTRPRYWLARFWLLIICVLLAMTGVAVYNRLKPLATGLNYRSPVAVVNISDLSWLADDSVVKSGQVVSNNKLTPTVLAQIDQAEQYILVDLSGSAGVGEQNLAGLIFDHLLINKKNKADLKIDVLINPGTLDVNMVAKLRAAGINVIEINLSALRDANIFYTSWWRIFCSWWAGNSGWGSRYNFKNNGRSLVLSDSQDRLVSIVVSGDITGVKSDQMLSGWRVLGSIGKELYKSEQAVAQMSGFSLSVLPANLEQDNSVQKNQYARVSYVSESMIRQNILETISFLTKDDELRLAVAVLAERTIIDELIKASQRGVKVKIILATKQEDWSAPNLAVAAELNDRSNGLIGIRWAQGMGFNNRVLLASRISDAKLTVSSGSANYTRRQLANYNLQSALSTEMDLALPISQFLVDNFDDQYYNKTAVYTVDYSIYGRSSVWRYWLYRLLEFSGLYAF